MWATVSGARASPATGKERSCVTGDDPRLRDRRRASVAFGQRIAERHLVERPRLAAMLVLTADDRGVDGIGEAGSERPVDLPLDLAEQNPLRLRVQDRSEEHTSELQSLMRISYAVFCLKKKITKNT